MKIKWLKQNHVLKAGQKTFRLKFVGKKGQPRLKWTYDHPNIKQTYPAARKNAQQFNVGLSFLLNTFYHYRIACGSTYLKYLWFGRD